MVDCRPYGLPTLPDNQVKTLIRRLRRLLCFHNFKVCGRYRRCCKCGHPQEWVIVGSNSRGWPEFEWKNL